MNSRYFKSRNDARAFTLAEVLITLGIIGVVAAFTIPTLFREYQKHQYVAQAKKVYSTWNQIIKQVAIDSGYPEDLSYAPMFGINTTHLTLGEELVKYIKVAKNCKTATNQGCWPSKTYAYYDGNNTSYSNFDGQSYYKFLTVDGMSFFIYSYVGDVGNTRANCAWSGNSRGVLGHMNKLCSLVRFDVNGLKGPNRWGRDTFEFRIVTGRGPALYPYGGEDSTDWWKSTNTCNSNNKEGYSCAGRIMEEGWQMNY